VTVRRRAVLGAAVALAAVAAFSGCRSGQPDGVLARQVFTHKDSVMSGLVASVGQARAAFADDVRSDGGLIPVPYWDGNNDPARFGLERGGAVVFDLHETPREVVFEVFIASGRRDASRDPFAESDGPYFGPPAVYLCFQIVAEVEGGRVVSWDRYERGPRSQGGACDARLAAAAGPGATVAAVHDFDG
jgi:hypothetical protein